jgi:hypothetical protein
VRAVACGAAGSRVGLRLDAARRVSDMVSDSVGKSTFLRALSHVLPIGHLPDAAFIAQRPEEVGGYLRQSTGPLVDARAPTSMPTAHLWHRSQSTSTDKPPAFTVDSLQLAVQQEQTQAQWTHSPGPKEVYVRPGDRLPNFVCRAGMGHRARHQSTEQVGVGALDVEIRASSTNHAHITILDNIHPLIQAWWDAHTSKPADGSYIA